jgi:hypothetical protein
MLEHFYERIKEDAISLAHSNEVTCWAEQNGEDSNLLGLLGCCTVLLGK